MKPEEKIMLYESSVEELYKAHSEVSAAFSRSKTITFTIWGSSLAFLSYLYSSNDPFIPKEQYGIIFYSIGLTLYILSNILFYLSIKAVTWQLPIERKVHTKLDFNSYISYLEYTKNLYVETLGTNISLHEKKQQYLSLGFYSFVIGAIVLVVIKNFSS